MNNDLVAAVLRYDVEVIPPRHNDSGTVTAIAYYDSSGYLRYNIVATQAELAEEIVRMAKKTQRQIKVYLHMPLDKMP